MADHEEETMSQFADTALRPAPSGDGRDNLSPDVLVYAHHSNVHDGMNVEIDAPAGTRVTVNINDSLALEVVIPS